MGELGTCWAQGIEALAHWWHAYRNSHRIDRCEEELREEELIDR